MQIEGSLIQKAERSSRTGSATASNPYEKREYGSTLLRILTGVQAFILQVSSQIPIEHI